MDQLLTELQLRWRLAKASASIASAAGQRAKRRKAARPYLSSAWEEGAAQELKSHGFSVWKIEDEERNELLESYSSVRESHKAAGSIERHTGKRFFEPDLSVADLTTYPIFLDIALAPKLLQVLTNAAGLVPHLEAVEVMISEPNAGPLTASQLWHRDVNDRVILKLFIYLNDVAEENGPFTFIPLEFSSSVPRNLPHYIPDSKVGEYVDEALWSEVMGKAGTAFLVDTRNCLHCGSRCHKQRIAYIATYSSGLRFMKQVRDWSGVLGERAKRLSSLQRMVCGLA